MRLLRSPSFNPRGYLVVLDPAKRRCGVACFIGQQLVYAGTVRAPPRNLARDVVNTGGRALGHDSPTYVVEVPQTYANVRAKDPNLQGLRDLIEGIDNLATHPLHGCYPSAWKGGIPKDVCRRRIRGFLTETECGALADVGEDTYDAIGLGLWYLRRAGRGMVVMRGTT